MLGCLEATSHCFKSVDGDKKNCSRQSTTVNKMIKMAKRADKDVDFSNSS